MRKSSWLDNTKTRKLNSNGYKTEKLHHDGYTQVKKMGKLRVILFVLFLSAGVCRAQTQLQRQENEIQELKKQVALQNRKLQILEKKLKQYETDRQKDNQAFWHYRAKIAAELNKQKSPVNVLPASLEWLKRIKIFGDLRYRYENIGADNDGYPNRSRNRFRMRVGLKAKVNEQWDAGFRLASGSKEPVSTMQTMSNSFSSKDIWLDRAYIDYHPSAIKNLHITGGKMANPFYRVGKNQLIWDSDVNPEGLAGRYSFDANPSDTVFVNGGWFFVSESANRHSNVSLGAAQTGIKHHFNKDTSVTGGVSYYDYENIEGTGNLDAIKNSFFGNTSRNGVFVNDYNILELFADVNTKIYSMPFALYGNYVNNVAASTNSDTGWLAGFAVNKAKKPGSWEFDYNYRELQSDAVVGAFSCGSFIGGGTNGRGSKFAAKYQIDRNVQAALNYLLDKRHDNDDNYRRLQADVTVTF